MRNFAANKELLDAAKTKQILVYANVKLSDTNDHLVNNRFEQIYRFFLSHRFVHVLDFDARFSNIEWNLESREKKFARVWELVDDLLVNNRNHIQTLNLTINFPLDARFLYRTMKFTKKTFKKLTIITIDNPRKTTALVLDILQKMPNLREVVIRGNVQMEEYDNVMKSNPYCSEFGTSYSTGNLPDM